MSSNEDSLSDAILRDHIFESIMTLEETNLDAKKLIKYLVQLEHRIVALEDRLDYAREDS